MIFGEGAKKALEYFNKGFEHKKIYESVRCNGIYQYTSPLVSKVTFPSENFPGLTETFWEGWIGLFPETLVQFIKAESKYEECFR